MEFKSYSSISNRASSRTGDCVPADTPWIATHKIHGTNASVTVTTDGAVQCGRRNAFLSPGEKFYKWESVLPTAAPWTDILAFFPDCTSNVTVYGELCGGKYLHPDVSPVPGAAAIQREVSYAPGNMFVAFDVRVDGVFVDFCSKACPVLDALGVPRVHVVFSGTRDEVTAWAQAHAADPVDPTWYGVSGLPILPSNLGEGWVIRPQTEFYNTDTDERVMYKIKNPTFREDGCPPTPSTLVDTSIIDSFVTAARVTNVLSKELPESVTFSRFGALVNLVAADVKKDADAAGVPYLDKAVKRLAGSLVRQYLASN